MNSTQADQARWNKVWQFLRGLGCKLQLGTDNAEMAVNFIRELPNPKQGQSPQAGSEAVSAGFELLTDIINNEEVVLMAGPSAQMDAKEPRYYVTMRGPERLLKQFADLF